MSPSTTYTVSLSGIQDMAGHAMADTSYSFTTAPSTNIYASLTLLSSSVNNGDTGVNPSGPFVFQYDSALNPVASVSSVSIAGPSNFYYPVTASASGSTLTVTPVAPLPANTAFVLTCSATAVSGGVTQTRIAFTTAPSADTTQPVVASITPADGTVLPTSATTFVLTFSKPLNPSTITASSISLYSVQGNIYVMLARSADNRSVSFAVPYFTGVSGFTVIATSAIQDLAGNSLVPL